MKLNLSLNQTRVLGALIEKEITTPDQYPLSLNGLTNACNQKSNREPVLSLSEAEVQDTLDELKALRLIREESGFGSRVAKIKHRFCNTEFNEIKLTEQALGIICVMFLRGPQTPGELRTRTNRLCEFDSVVEVENTLTALINRDDGPFVEKLPREPGKRESRYGHLFSGPVSTDQRQSHFQPTTATLPVHEDPCDDRLAHLEMQVQQLRAELNTIKAQLGID